MYEWNGRYVHMYTVIKLINSGRYVHMYTVIKLINSVNVCQCHTLSGRTGSALTWHSEGRTFAAH